MNSLPSVVREIFSFVLPKYSELFLAAKGIWVQKPQISWELNYIVLSERKDSDGQIVVS